MAISNILKDIRVERNLIQEDLAEATGSYQPKMKEFSGATPVSVEQEFYINMLLSNLVSLIKNDADEEIDITSKSSNKFRYQANRAFIIGRIKIIFPKILCDLSELSVIEKLYKEAVRCRSQILPGRSFPRKKLKSKGRSHFRNKKSAL